MILSKKTKLKLLAKGLILTAITAESIINMPLIEPAFASTMSATTGDIQFVQNNALLGADTYTIRNSTNKNVDYIYNKIYTGLKNHQDTIEFSAEEISKYNIVNNTDTDPKKVYINVVTECPDIYFAPTRVLESFGSVACLYVSYIYNEDEIAKIDKELNAEADRIVKLFDGYSDIRKVYEIHDYIANKCTYDDEMAEASMPKSSLNLSDWDAYMADNERVLRENRKFFNTHNVYGALIDGQAVCEGYAKAFSFLLNKAGIDAGILCSNNHAWSYVQIDGKYYQVDLTWDDEDDFFTSTPYELFATTTTLMENKHDAKEHPTLTEQAYVPDCSDKKFDNFLRNINTDFGGGNNIFRAGNKLYELKNKYIYSYDLNGENKKLVKDLTQHFYVESLKTDNENIYVITGENNSKYDFDLKKIDIKTGTVSNVVNLMTWFNLDGSDYSYFNYYISGNKLTAIYDNFVTETTKTMTLDESVESENLTKATNAVVKAESTLDRSDYNDAKGLVDALNDGADKTGLADRLTVVLTQIEAKEQSQSEAQKLTDATNAVAKAESTLDRSDYNDAKDLVDALNDGADKTGLADRLTVVLTQIEAKEQSQSEAQKLTDATNAVAKAESTLDRSDYNDAKDLVDALNDSSDKTALADRLTAVLTQIEAKEQSQSEAQKLTDATNAVAKAEASLDRSDYNDAKGLVDVLNDSSDKTALAGRLAEVLNKIKAKEQSQSEVQKLTDATNAVAKAEASLDRSDYNDAKGLVDVLNDSSDKTALAGRLAEVLNKIKANEQSQSEAQKLTDATNAVAKAEASLDRSDYNGAKDLVDALNDGADKTALLDRLTEVLNKIKANEEPQSEAQKLTDATNAVAKAEASLDRSDYNGAKDLVDALNDGADKTALLDRLTEVLNKIKANEEPQSEAQKLTDATNAVAKAEDSLHRSDYNDAKDLVDALNDGTDKTALTDRLTAVINKIKTNEQSQSEAENLTKATNAVVKAEVSLDRSDYNDAKDLVDALNDGTDKTALTDRLTAVINKIKTNEQSQSEAENLTKATNAVVKAEVSLDRSDYNDAKALVDTLNESADKTVLANRLTAVLNKIKANEQSASNNGYEDKYDNAYDALEEFKDKLTTSKYKKAKELIYDLDDSDDRDELIKELKKYKKKLDRKNDNDDDNDSSSDVNNNSNGNSITNNNTNYNYIANSTGPLMPTASFTSNHSFGWAVDKDGKWYYYNPTGSKRTGWLAEGSNSYLFDSNGQMITGWYYDSSIGKWYYFNKLSDGVEGQLRTGWLKSNEKWYYLDPNNGTMVTDRYINGYYLGSDGAWV